MQLSVKNVEERVFREFKAEVVRRGENIGGALNVAMKAWLNTQKKRDPKCFLEFKPKRWGKGTEKTSEEIDKILYGNDHH